MPKRITSIKRAAIATGLIAALTGSGAILAQAKDKEKEHDDSALLSEAKVTISQAIAKAEQEAKGKADKAKLEREKGNLVYEVDVVSGGKTVEVTVDAKSGKVLSSKTEQAGEHEGNENDGD